jgi:hypothetical protein
MTISGIFPALGLAGAQSPGATAITAPGANFLDMITGALHGVSAAQSAASKAEAGGCHTAKGPGIERSGGGCVERHGGGPQ